MPRGLIILPPVPLSKRFIDVPALGILGAYQAAAILRRLGWRVKVLDGFSQTEADLFLDGDAAWLGQPRDLFIPRLSKATADLVLLCGSPFLVHPLAREWRTELVQRLAGLPNQGPLVLADLFTGGMHYLGYESRDLLAGLPGLRLLARFEGERLLERAARTLGREPPDRTEVWEEVEAFSLEGLPAPAYDLLDADKYFEFLGRVMDSPWRPGPFPAEPKRSLPLVTQRGCPFGCVFCTRNPGLPEPRRQVRSFPLEAVAGWLDQWARDLGLQRVVILDEIPNLDPRRFDDLLSILEHLKLCVEFPNGLRADRLRQDQVNRLAKLTSGLKVSLESACPRVQHDVLHKDLDPGAVERVAGWCQDAKVPLQVHVLVGTPGEDREEILDTLRFALRLNRTTGAQPLLQFSTPLPGTELERICRASGARIHTPGDPYDGFQHGSSVATDRFDSRFLEQAAAQFSGALASGSERKVITNLTYRCNNHCVFCAVGDRPAVDADVSKVVEALQRYRQAGFDLLDIDGGEPTLHPGLLDVVGAARDLGYTRISLTTNARRLSYHAFAHRLAASGVNELLVSLHAPDDQSHEALTQAPGSFAQTLEGLKNALNEFNADEAVGVNTTLVVENLGCCRSLGELLERLGVRRWNLQVVTPFGRARSEHVPDDAALASVLSNLLSHPPVGMRIQIVNCLPCQLPGYEDRVAVDFAKAERRMVFVGEEGVNLKAYLATRRIPEARCTTCVYSLSCPGRYTFDPLAEDRRATNSLPP